jgi:hypothetical protein
MDQRKDPNQGEGDRKSARRYDKHVEEFVSEGRVPEAAHEAKDYVEREPSDAARAERDARRGPRGRYRATLDELVAKGRSLLERFRARVARK